MIWKRLCRLVEVLLDNEYREPNEYHLDYRASGATGIYFVRLQAGGKTESLKIIMLK